MLRIELSHRFGDFALDVDITAGDGITMLFGPSGAGKSTIAALLARMYEPDDGRITANRLWHDLAGSNGAAVVGHCLD